MKRNGSKRKNNSTLTDWVFSMHAVIFKVWEYRMKETENSALSERQRYCLEQVRAFQALGKTFAESVYAMYAGKNKLVEKGILPRTQPARLRQAQIVDTVCNSGWRIQLPNSVSVAFAGSVDARSLAIVFSAAANVA